jgi:hypothetical protein
MCIRWMICLALIACVAPPRTDSRADDPAQSNEDLPTRPFLAIWRDSDGYVLKSEAPYLRAAFWDDGRVMFSADQSEWGNELRHGKISRDKVERLKAALGHTGIFELKGNCYLGPDLPVDCVMVDLGARKQILYWVEGMVSWMKEPHHRDFVKSWTAVNDLAALACPDQFEPAKERFKRPPRSWYLKQMIQSE